MAIFVSTPRSIGPLELDASLREDHTSNLDVTSSPVERGSDISDHAVLKPKQVTIAGGYSNFPLAPNESILTNENSARVQAAWQQLLDLQESKELLEVQTGLKLYENMLITGLSCSQDEATGNVLYFTAQLREVRVVDTLQIQRPASLFEDKTTGDKTTSSTPRGDVDAPVVDPNTPANKSWLKRVFS